MGVPGVAQDIPVCTEAESLAIFDDKTKVEKALYIKGFRHSGRIFDTVLIPNRIIDNGRNVIDSCRCFYMPAPLRWRPILIMFKIFRKNMI